MFWEVSVFKNDRHITTCTLNATDPLEAIKQVIAEAKSWPGSLFAEIVPDEKEQLPTASYEFQTRLIP